MYKQDIVYSPTYKDWYYSLVDIPVYSIIQKELIALDAISNTIPGLAKHVTKYYYTILKNDIVDCPQLITYLNNIGLYSSISKLMFFRTTLDASSAIHTDGPSTSSTVLSLNIPLLNYDNSYIAWYKPLTDSYLTSTFNNPHLNNKVTDASKVQEIKRVETSDPLLINTSVFHKAWSASTDRLICGIRFNHILSVDELLRLNITTPYRQI